MRRFLDGAVVSAIGQVNRLVFGLSRGGVVLYRFHGIPGIVLTVTTPAEPLGTTVTASCLPDGDFYLVLAHPLEEPELCGLLDSSTGVEAGRGPGETTVPTDLERLADPVERATVLKRALSRASLGERAEVQRLGLAPVARLRPHQRLPETGHSSCAVSLHSEGPTLDALFKVI